MKTQEIQDEFSRFEAAHGRAVWEEVLKSRREAEGNPNCRPSWMKAMGYQAQVTRILRHRFYTEKTFGGAVSAPKRA
jgi:hypothetical protein